ncbi:hypothetical protein LIER_12429 [Lithospermum erythrorhizon]|uniref:Uncharacterized protein n=1 Tax=Lithospermum erythrorhizon TaxID=34254 RepID=A0AAV3PT73_LITER
MYYVCNDCFRKYHSVSGTTFIDWMNSPFWQAMAIAILVQYYDPNELLDLLSATPRPSRAGLLVSLLYKLCGWLLDPVNGLDGLLRSGHWAECYSAVRRILNGEIIAPLEGPDNISDQMMIDFIDANNYVPADDIIGYIDNQWQMHLFDDGPITNNPSGIPSTNFERGEPSTINNQQENCQVMNDPEAPANSSDDDEDDNKYFTLDLTLGRPTWTK